MKTRLLALVALLAFVASAPRALAQATPKTADITQEIGTDGAITITMLLSFDAAPWKQWKAQVGDDPSRLRAVMRHQFSAYVIDDFKFEKDDLNRTAKVVMHGPAGPELRKDLRFRIPVEKEFQLINNIAREWYFSGNNPYAGNTLNKVKIVLPPNARDVQLAYAGSAEQGLIYSLDFPPGKSRTFVVLGLIVMVIGAGVVGAGFLLGRGAPPAAPQPAAP